MVSVATMMPPSEPQLRIHDMRTMPSTEEDRYPSGAPTDAPFPYKLLEMLDYASHAGHTGIVDWLPHGRAFKIHDKTRFMTDVAPKFFKATKVRSVHRQLNLWGFKRIPSGADCDAWYHESFVRGRPELLKRILRTKVKGKNKPSVEGPEAPNFYGMPSVEPSNERAYRTALEAVASQSMSDEGEPRAAEPHTKEDYRSVFVRLFTDEEQAKMPRRVSLTSSPEFFRATMPPDLAWGLPMDGPKDSLPPLARRPRYCQEVQHSAMVDPQMIDPLPFGFDTDVVSLESPCDEFTNFIDQVGIQDPQA